MGDQEWVVDQAKVPFVLRPIPGSDSYQLIG